MSICFSSTSDEFILFTVKGSSSIFVLDILTRCISEMSRMSNDFVGVGDEVMYHAIFYDLRVRSIHSMNSLYGNTRWLWAQVAPQESHQPQATKSSTHHTCLSYHHRWILIRMKVMRSQSFGRPDCCTRAQICQAPCTCC